MKIGIDASRAFIEKRTGIEEYSYRLIKNLTILDTSNHQIFLYVKNREEVKLELPENFFIKEIKRNRLWTQFGLSKEMRKNPVDVLFVPAYSIPFIHPKNTVVTIHGLEFKYYPESYSFKEKIMLEFNTLLAVKWSKKIIVPSENTKKDLIKFYKVNPEKIKVIYHGVESIKYQISNIKISEKRSFCHSREDGNPGLKSKNQFKTNTSNNFTELPDKYLSENIFNILFIGRLEKRKNLVNLVEAFNIFKSRYTLHDIRYILTIVGKEGFGFKEIKSAINQSPYKNDIIVKGYVSEKEKKNQFEKADIFALISFYEGFGLPILEAMSHGVPVVCSDVSSLPEIAGKAGLTVNPNNIEEISEAFEKIICNQHIKDDMIEKGFENMKKFSWKKCARETMDVLLD